MTLRDPLVTRLVDALRVLPGVGPRTAQRLTLHLLERDREGGLRLAETLRETLEGVRHCPRCRNFTSRELCAVCEAGDRDPACLCIVETAADLETIEQSGAFRGGYFVLGGRLSPLDGIGPEALGLDVLDDRIARDGVAELILATNPTVEGDATAHYLSERYGDRVARISRLASGMPVGGEIEYLDGGTLARALRGRTAV